MILITGATGSNGTEIIKGLAGHGTQIRAMVRRPQKADFFPPNVEQTIADFDDPDSLRRVLAGVQQAFLVTPSSERVEEQQLRFVGLAREAGLQHIVYLSQLHAAQDSPVRFLRYHAAVEHALSESGLQHTNLRPNLYMQGLLLFKSLIVGNGRIIAPIGDARVSTVDVRDIADVAIESLLNPVHRNQTYDVTGPEALTHREMASQLSATLGRRIEFVDVQAPAFRDLLSVAHMPAWQADGLVEDYGHYKRGEAEAVSNMVQSVTGHPPRTFVRFARDYRDAFLQ
jgi:uncharacterized protein YbjT (DUF2867 family)